ncbi:hypothetical protein PtA15_7A392 [Puccinia triticina]|uniref:Uncharacterized protein n=1 Tax=Puccinia triticina TaxID=208348 RepID=A0ABY7CPT1_9BASI|nr:uncharacterized protein PtA15_7A392 [Puccinia triticina]WAQ86664.1 hypothetical protein PtA15_7A392 [Puccinia triticina]
MVEHLAVIFYAFKLSSKLSHPSGEATSKPKPFIAGTEFRVKLTSNYQADRPGHTTCALNQTAWQVTNVTTLLLNQARPVLAMQEWRLTDPPTGAYPPEHNPSTPATLITTPN